MAFENVVLMMEDMNLFHLFLPWLLVLAVTYGVLQKEEIFEEESITATVSLAVAFMAIGGFYFFAPPELFSHFAAVIGFAVFGFLGLFILLAVVGVDITDFEDAEKKFPAIAAAGIAVLGVLGVLVYQFDMLGMVLSGLDFSDTNISFDEHIMPVLILVFLLLVVVFVTREGGD